MCQFDADHVPERSYLSTLLPAFLDPQVGGWEAQKCAAELATRKTMHGAMQQP